MPVAQPHRVLIVDDDPSIHELIRAMLAGTAWTADTAFNGEEALSVLGTQSYDLLLTDILMPGIDGLALLGQLRAGHPGIPVIMMTVKNTPDHILGSLKREAAAFIAKPFSRDTLLGTLQAALSDSVSEGDIQILSDKPHWISLQIRCRIATAERLTQFMRELPSDLEPGQREQIGIHGADRGRGIDDEIGGAGLAQGINPADQIRKGEGGIARRVDSGLFALIEPVGGGALRIGV